MRFLFSRKRCSPPKKMIKDMKSENRFTISERPRTIVDKLNPQKEKNE
jgi:hypothetical protein